jgi:uncharacterized protein YndB with AHSA1/START domain
MLQKVGKLELNLVGDNAIQLTRLFNAPRDLVWEANTKPDLVRRWLLGPEGWTMPICEIDLRVGGRYRYVWAHADGREMGMAGAYAEVSPTTRLVSRELFDDDWTGGEAENALALSDIGARTLMTLTVTYASSQAREGALKSGMLDGMETGYARLDDVLAG